jgi:arylsulfatase A-like enzyme
LDDLVGGVVGKLRDSGQLSNTYIVFTSDNGWHHGEHRIPEGKSRPYEESIRMPLLIRGPGVQAGSTTNELVVNTDYLPTFTDLAGISTPGYVDGRSLRPILEGSTSTTWRTAFLLELKAQRNGDRPALYGVRTSDGKKYIEYRDGERELFDLSRDPYELRDYYSAGAPPTGLASRIDALKTCAGTSCRSAENGP